MKRQVLFFPSKPKLDLIIATKEDEGSNLFDSDEEEDEDDDNIEELYTNEPKADAWQALSWEPDAVHRSDKAIIVNINVLGSDNCTCNSCDKKIKDYLKTTIFV